MADPRQRARILDQGAPPTGRDAEGLKVTRGDLKGEGFQPWPHERSGCFSLPSHGFSSNRATVIKRTGVGGNGVRSGPSGQGYGGGRDVLDEPSHVRWALELRTVCEAVSAVFPRGNWARDLSIRVNRSAWWMNTVAVRTNGQGKVGRTRRRSRSMTIG